MSKPIPIETYQSKKQREQRQARFREEQEIKSCEIIIMATGCSKMEAYITLIDNCNDPIAAIDKLTSVQY